jgi:hypothetical protein
MVSPLVSAMARCPGSKACNQPRESRNDEDNPGEKEAADSGSLSEI